VLGSRDSRSSESSHSAGASRITIFVLFAGVGKTLDALSSAGRLARDLDAHIEIIVPEIVPYPLPLDEPPVLRSFWNQRYRTIVEQAGIDTSIHVCFCREPRETVDRLLNSGSIVVIGTRHVGALYTNSVASIFDPLPKNNQESYRRACVNLAECRQQFHRWFELSQRDAAGVHAIFLRYSPGVAAGSNVWAGDPIDPDKIMYRQNTAGPIPIATTACELARRSDPLRRAV
jgi:hypothetical protein